MKMKPAVSLPPVNWVEMIEASVPNRKKSYHSKAVPTEEAATTSARAATRVSVTAWA